MSRTHNAKKENPKPAANPGGQAAFFQNGFCRGKATRHGLMMYNPNDLIGQTLETYGEWAYGEIELLSQVIKPGAVILDVGAYIGTHTLSFSKMAGPDGFVFAFEPQRVIFEFLCTNILINNLMNAFPVHAAVSDRAGEIQVPILDPNQPSNSAGFAISGHTIGDSVQVVTIDSLTLAKCSLIKVDVEGMENDVIAGGKQTILRTRPILFVENNGYSQSAALIRQIMELNYQSWWFFTPDVKNNGAFNPEINDKNMLCLPREWNTPVNGLEPVLDENDTGARAYERLTRKTA